MSIVIEFFQNMREIIAGAYTQEIHDIGAAVKRHVLLIPLTHKAQDFTAEIDAREAAQYKLEEERGPGPRRIEAEEKAQTLQGFCDLVNRHKGPTTAISARASGDAVSLVATIDYHGASSGKGPDPRWKKHTVTYSFPYSVQFRSWLAARSWVDKKAFLDFCEGRALDLAAPEEVTPGPITTETFQKVLIIKGGFTHEQRKAAALEAVFGGPAELFKAARVMYATTNESLEEKIDDMGQVEISYKKKDTIENAAARKYYLVEVRVFEGDEDKQVVPVRLDLEVDSGRLQLRFALLGIDRIIENAFAEACKEVEESTGLAPIRAVF